MGYPHCIEILLDHGARMDIKNNQRNTAYNLVKGKQKCEKVFLQAFAKFQIPQRTIEQQRAVEGGRGWEEFWELVGGVEDVCAEWRGR